MADTTAQRTHPWLGWAAFGLLMAVVIRQFSPHWSYFPEYNYGWAIPFLCVYLFWERWQLRPSPDAPSGRALAFGIAGLAMIVFSLSRVVQEANTTWRLSSWTMAAGAVAIVLCGIYLAGGKSWLRYFWFPAAFFLVAVPWPTPVELATIQTLTRLNVNATVEVLTIAGIPALPQGNVIEISTGLVGIDEACSGIRSLQATLMIALFFGETYHFGFWRRVGLVASGVGLAFIFNVGRTFLLVSVAAREGLGAMARWHDPAGVTILLGCFLALWGLAFLQKRKAPAPLPAAAPAASRPLPPFFLVAIMGWLALTELGTEFWYRAHETDALRNPKWSQWNLRWPVQARGFKIDEMSESLLHQMSSDEGRSAEWTDGDGHDWRAFYFRWQPARSLAQRVRIQGARFHRPEICLPAAGLTLREDLGVKWEQTGALRFPFHIYRFDDHGNTLYVFYSLWEEGVREQSIANMRENTSARLEAAWQGTRGLGQRLLEMAVSGATSESEAETALQHQLSLIITE
jgi:exosortase